jgi:Sec-independent protein translocase protein TatA
MWEAGATLVGALFGNRRLTTAAGGAGRVLRQRSDVGRAKENVEALEQQIQDLDTQLQAELAALDATTDAAQRPLSALSLTPKKTNVSVQRVVLAWVPAGEGQ